MELRYYSEIPEANGVTDFRGSTEVFSTDQRIDYLKTYEQLAGQFFDNPDWDQKVVTDEEAKDRLAAIKPQPLPEVRKRIPLSTWKWMGFKPGIIEKDETSLAAWSKYPGVQVRDESLHVEQTELTHAIPAQAWRFMMRWQATMKNPGEASFQIGATFEAGFSSDGSLFYEGQDGKVSAGAYEPGKTYQFMVDVDLENGGFNLYIDGQKTADFVPTKSTDPVNTFGIKSTGGLVVDNLYGDGYVKTVFTDNTNSRDVPFSIDTIIDENFSVRPDIQGWSQAGYDDSEWATCELPYPHGGQRFKGESLYLRKEVSLGDFTAVELNFETIDPGGEVWVNGEVVHVQHNRLPATLDISKYLKKNATNLIAVRVFPNKVKVTNRHTSADLYTGWFAGRAWLDLRADSYVKDLFVYATEVGPETKVQVNAVLRNDHWYKEEREIHSFNAFEGTAKLTVTPWFPEESDTPVFEQSYPVYLRMERDFEWQQEITLDNPGLWSPDTPNLYKFSLTLEDEQQNAIDDVVITTGLRVISQEGGTFRINGKPSVMNGALLFAYKTPLEDIARTVRSGPDYWLVKELMMIKRLNANTVRMSIHHGTRGGVNDPRFAEYGDQLGVMFQWTTGTWVRTGSPWLLDFDALSVYVKQVRNHPSIVMWQPGNHPEFLNFRDEGNAWMTKIYSQIYPNDPSRLISSTASNSRFGDDGAPNDTGTKFKNGERLDDPGVWMDPMIARGSMEHATGYATDWSSLRKFPYPDDFVDQQGWRKGGFRVEYLTSSDRAWFDFESEESAGHPNEDLIKGKPYSGYRSYEVRYDDKTIGRRLTPDEWRKSQAWQGFSAFEAYKKKRWFDYDGQAWCTLHGGGNSGTYEKPLIDYHGHSKIVFHTVKMAFQEVLATSQSVDLVYGSEDHIPVIAMNQGEEKKVTVKVDAKDINGNLLAEKVYNDVTLPAGRTVTKLDPFKPRFKEEGYVVVEYTVTR
jgi:hypothetical protein